MAVSAAMVEASVAEAMMAAVGEMAAGVAIAEADYSAPHSRNNLCGGHMRCIRRLGRRRRRCRRLDKSRCRHSTKRDSCSTGLRPGIWCSLGHL
eukprot:2015433-Prymnesium_polylepis.1